MKEKLQRKGSVVLVILLILMVIVASIPIMARLISVSNKKVKLQLNSVAQAENIANAGLADAISWFRRYSDPVVKSNDSGYDYPDAAFDPGNGADTIDEDIGIVREFQINDTGSIWARYEVRKQADPSDNPYDPYAVHDITSQRSNDFIDGDGLSWYIAAYGYVYLNKDPSKAYNENPNQILATALATTEIRQLEISLPAPGAFFVYDGGTSGLGNRTVNVNSGARIIGGNTGYGAVRIVGYPPYILADGIVRGGLGNDVDIANSYSLEPKAIFGTHKNYLINMADFTVNSSASLPSPLPAMSLIYIDGDAVFNGANVLQGSGILFVDGNLTVDSASNSLFSGLIYVSGTADIEGPGLFSGAVIAVGGLTLDGTTDIAQIEYDEAILNITRQKICFYRQDNSAYQMFSLMKK